MSRFMLLRVISLFSIIVTFSLLMLGGFVHNTGSSLACPDWPLCYGQFFPNMEGGILIEHGHRLLASFVGFLTILLTYFSYKKKRQLPTASSERLFKLSLLALLFVICQGILGGITVIYRLPTIVSTSHLALSMVYFCTLILIFKEALVSENEETITKYDYSKLKLNWNINSKSFLQLSTFIVYLQIVLGAFMRHAGSGVACGLGMKNAILCTDTQTWVKSVWPSFPASQLHMSHRLFALVATFFVIFGVIQFLRDLKKVELPEFFKKRFKLLAISSLILVFIQVLLGVGAVAMNLRPVITTFHLAGGALLLGVLWYLINLISTFERLFLDESNNSTLSDVVELMKPKLSGLVLATIFVGMMIGPVQVGFFRGLFLLLCSYMVVAGGAILNCYYEREVDGLMDRTRNRALPSGRFRPSIAFLLGGVLSGVSLLLIFIFINKLTFILALAAWILYVFIYTPMKQKSELALAVGAIPGALPCLMGYTGAGGELDLGALALFSVMFIWQFPHFMAISIYLSEDYEKANIYVYANSRGYTWSRHLINITNLILVGVSLSPTYVGIASAPYYYSAVSLGVVMVLIAAKGYMHSVENKSDFYAWARQYFLASVIYLPILLGTMIFLK